MGEDCREEIVNQLIMWASGHGIPPLESKYDLYMILSGVEIMRRCTEVAELKEDRNEMLLKKFLVVKNVKGCTPRTIEFYGKEIHKILDTIGKTVDDVTADDIRLYMAKRLKVDRVSEVTVGNEQRALSSFFNWLYTEELIKKNPISKVELIKSRKTKKKALTEMEIEQLRSAAQGEREKAIIEILLSTGCRVSELVQIKRDNIDGNRILVIGKGNKERYVYLNARAQFALEKYIEERKDVNPYLFPSGKNVVKMPHNGLPPKEMINWWKNPKNIRDGHADKSTVEAAMRKIAKLAGVERANPHKFRRTCATMALRRGMPIEQVSKMLGHEQLTTTQIYLDLTEDELALAHKKYVN